MKSADNLLDPAYLAFRRHLETGVACAWSELRRLRPELRAPFESPATVAMMLTGLAPRRAPVCADGAYRIDG